MQPLAGPVDPARFRLTYFAGTPAAVVAAPGALAPTANLSAVRVQVVATSTERVSNVAQRDSGVIDVSLRN